MHLPFASLVLVVARTRARRTSTSESFFSSFTLNSEYPAGVSNRSNIGVDFRALAAAATRMNESAARGDRPTAFSVRFCVMGFYGYTERDECPNWYFLSE